MSSYAGATTAEKQRDMRRAMKAKQKASSRKKNDKVEVDKILLQNRGELTVTCELAQSLLDKEQKNWKSEEAMISCLMKFLTGGKKRFFVCQVHDDVPVKQVWINQYGFRPNAESRFFFVKGVNLLVKHDEDRVINITRKNGQLAFQIYGV